MTSSGVPEAEVLYPRRFEIYRLEAFGDPPYLTVEEARQNFEAGRGLFVIPDGEPPEWILFVSVDSYRFSVTFHAPNRAHVREATWERVDGRLFCRRMTDSFFPEGDPQKSVSRQMVITVMQEISTDGVVDVSWGSPLSDTVFREVSSVPVEQYWHPVPEFGDWGALIEASRGDVSGRFGWDAIDVALGWVDACITAGVAQAEGGPADPASGWRVSVGADDVVSAAETIVRAVQESGGDDAAPSADPLSRVPVLVRGNARVLPLMVQADPAVSQRDPDEERHRATVLAGWIDAAAENRAGRGIVLDLAQRSHDRVGSYLAALRQAGATAATFWVVEDTHALVLVWAGDSAAGSLTLALHVVPASWVSQRRPRPPVDGIDVRWSIGDLASDVCGPLMRPQDDVPLDPGQAET